MPKKKVRKNRPDPLKLRAARLRASLLTRGKKHGVEKTTPTKEELLVWFSIEAVYGFWVCYYSGLDLRLTDIHIDHKQPLHRGGTNCLSNLCICSKKMNTAKGSMTEQEFKSLLAFLSTWEDRGELVLRRLRQGYF